MVLVKLTTGDSTYGQSLGLRSGGMDWANRQPHFRGRGSMEKFNAPGTRQPHYPRPLFIPASTLWIWKSPLLFHPPAPQTILKPALGLPSKPTNNNHVALRTWAPRPGHMAVSMATCRSLHITRNQTDPGSPSLYQLGPKSGALCLLLCSFRPRHR